MATYRRVYDSRHLQADYQEPGSVPDPNRVWATFTTLVGDVADFLTFMFHKIV